MSSIDRFTPSQPENIAARPASLGQVTTPESPRLPPRPSSAPPASIQFTQTQTANPAKIRRTPLENCAMNAIMQLTVQNAKFREFNKSADALRTTAGWEKAIETQVKVLSNSQLQELSSLVALELRGFDRQIVSTILTQVQQARLDRSMSVSKNIDTLLKLLETEIVHIPPSDMKKLGGGAVNTVYLIKSAGLEGVFKPDPSALSALTLLKEQHFGTATASGIPPGDNAHLGYRAVASSIVDRALYGENTISVRTRFAIVNGQRGILMDLAAGKSPKVNEMVREPVDLSQYPHIAEYIRREKPGPEQLKAVAAALHLRKVEIVGDQLIGTSARIEGLNPNNPSTLAELLKLQIKDIITGECDRHPGNYFLDLQGNVTGIDEDCCFGVNAIPEGIDVRSQPALKGVVPNNASLMLRMPPVVTQEIKSQITTLYQHRGELREKLQPYITDAEVDATIIRLEKLFEHVNSSNCLTVNSKVDLISFEVKKRLDTNNSYYVREKRVFENQKGWNELREHRVY